MNSNRFTCAPHTAKEDQLLHQYLTIIDVLRSSRTREVNAAKKLLQEALSRKQKAPQ